MGYFVSQPSLGNGKIQLSRSYLLALRCAPRTCRKPLKYRIAVALWLRALRVIAWTICYSAMTQPPSASVQLLILHTVNCLLRALDVFSSCSGRSAKILPPVFCIRIQASHYVCAIMSLLGKSLCTFGKRTTAGYSSILRRIASRLQDFTSGSKVAPSKRIAIAVLRQLHACCQVETRRDAILDVNASQSFLVI